MKNLAQRTAANQCVHTACQNPSRGQLIQSNHNVSSCYAWPESAILKASLASHHKL